MSISTEITRIQTARNTLRAKAVNLGIGLATDKLDDLATEYDGIENNGAVSAEVKEGETYTIPKGYHNGSGTVSGVAGGGNYKLQSKSVDPTKSQQNITPDAGYYGRRADWQGHCRRGWQARHRYDAQQRRGGKDPDSHRCHLHRPSGLPQRRGHG